MKYKKLLLFIPLLALAACDGQTPEGGEDLSSNSNIASSGEVSNPDASSDVNSSTSLVPTDPSHREEILTAIKNINSFTAEVEQVFNAHFNVSESVPQPDFDANISTKDVMKNVGKRMSVNSSGTSLITYKTSEYAAKAHSSVLRFSIKRSTWAASLKRMVMVPPPPAPRRTATFPSK